MDYSQSGQQSGWATYAANDWNQRKPVTWLDDWPFWETCLQQYAAGKLVLELACGNGRITAQIAQLGYDVTAVDINPHFLSHAEQYLQKKRLVHRVDLHLGDVVYLDIGKQFKFALMTDWAFPAILNQNDQLLFFKHLHKHLVLGGVFVFDTIFPTVRQLQLTFDGEKLLWQDGRTYNALTQIETRPSGNYMLQFRHTSLAELHLLARLTGFEIIEQYGDFERRPLQGFPEENLIIVMRKSDE